MTHPCFLADHETIRCPEPSAQGPDGLCAVHRWREWQAGLQADWQHAQDHAEYNPGHAERLRLAEQREREARYRRVLEEMSRADFTGDGTHYGVAALAGVVRNLAGVGEGGRNNALTRASFKVGQLTAGAELRADVGVRALRRAGEAMGLHEREVQHVVKEAFGAGLQFPRSSRDA